MLKVCELRLLFKFNLNNKIVCLGFLEFKLNDTVTT